MLHYCQDFIPHRSCLEPIRKKLSLLYQRLISAKVETIATSSFVDKIMMISLNEKQDIVPVSAKFLTVLNEDLSELARWLNEMFGDSLRTASVASLSELPDFPIATESGTFRDELNVDIAGVEHLFNGFKYGAISSRSQKFVTISVTLRFNFYDTIKIIFNFAQFRNRSQIKAKY